MWCFRHDGLLGQFEATLIRDMANSGLIFGITSFAKLEGVINETRQQLALSGTRQVGKARQPLVLTPPLHRA
jgi:hypothetical protein